MDILLVLLSAPLAIILVVIAALAIKLSSRGPVFFVQERLGRNGVPFPCYKLRTMVEGAEQGTPQWATESDPRVTPVGRFLRQSRLDELPQLYNVWRGEMSFVGVRPIRQHFAGILIEKEPLYYLRFLARVDTGLTLGYLVRNLQAREPAGLAVCTLLDRRVRRLSKLPLPYTGVEVPDRFDVGYGLDHRELWRNLPHLAALPEEAQAPGGP